MLLLGCIHKYQGGKYGDWECQDAIDSIFREYKPNLAYINLK